MNKYNRQQDDIIDEREATRVKARKVQLTQEQIQEQGDKLYESVANSLRVGKNSVRCKLRPNCVFEYVIEKLKQKGFTAKHTYNDGLNAYDYLDVRPNI